MGSSLRLTLVKKGVRVNRRLDPYNSVRGRLVNQKGTEYTTENKYV